MWIKCQGSTFSQPPVDQLDVSQHEWLGSPLDVSLYRRYNKSMRITSDPRKRLWTLQKRGLDMHRAKEVFAGLHLTRPDDRRDYGEPRYFTAGWLDSRLVVFAWTPRGKARRVISMRHCHGREAKSIVPYLSDKR